MQLEPPINENYCATIIYVPELHVLEGRDRLKGFNMFGHQAIVSIDTPVGELGVLFTPETQLSFEYMFENNLHSHSTKRVVEKGQHDARIVQLNRDGAAKGYMGDNRRVRAIKLGGHRSDALYMPLSSLFYIAPEEFAGVTLKEGDTFDHIGEHEICRKYVTPRKGNGMGHVQEKLIPRVDEKVFPQHFDTPQYFRVDRNLNPNSYVYVTQKLHGTSIRIGNTIIKTKLSWLERFVARLTGNKDVEYFEFDMIYGSHKAIKDANNPNQMHFYSHDLWSAEGKKLDGLLPENYIVYGELVGWVPPANPDGVFVEGAGFSPIQKNYTYQIPPGVCKLYIYRVCVVNGEGIVADLSWDAVKEFCASIGAAHVPELWRGELWRLQERQVPDMGEEGPSFLEENFLDKRYHDMGWLEALPLDAESPCDEGVCLRIDSGIIPTIVKAKSPLFYQHETDMADKGVLDIESSEDTAAEGDVEEEEPVLA